MPEVIIDLTEHEASTLYEATNTTLHWIKDQIEKAQKERFDILKHIIGARLGLKVTFIGSIKRKPYVMEFEESKLHSVREISKTIEFHCRRGEVLSNINQKLNDSTRHSVEIYNYEKLKETLFYKLHTFFTEYYPGTSLKVIQDYFYELRLY